MEIPWYEQEQYLEWERLARREYHGLRQHPPLDYSQVVKEILESKESK